VTIRSGHRGSCASAQPLTADAALLVDLSRRGRAEAAKFSVERYRERVAALHERLDGVDDAAGGLPFWPWSGRNRRSRADAQMLDRSADSVGTGADEAQVAGRYSINWAKVSASVTPPAATPAAAVRANGIARAADRPQLSTSVGPFKKRCHLSRV
jgi:hypothetical protein